MSAISYKPVTYFNIKFENNEHGIFRPGETMYGTVELYAEKKIKKTKGLTLEVTGNAQCNWTKRKIYKTIKFEGSQKFMEHVSHFFGRVDGAAIEVSIGVHLYQFTCQIPENAAESYQGSYGKINYSVKVTLDIPFMPDITHEREFRVIRVLDLNDFPWLRCKSDSETDNGVGMDCCETMPLVVVLKIQKSGFATGEKLKVKIEATNQGPGMYSSSILALDRVEICSSHFPVLAYKKSYKVINYIPSRSIKPFESAIFEESIKVPDEMYGTSDSSCETVRVSYQLRFSSKSNRRSKVQAILPIFIGHKALTSDDDDISSCYDSQSEPVEEVKKS